MAPPRFCWVKCMRQALRDLGTLGKLRASLLFPMNPKMVEERKPPLILAFSPREKGTIVPASGKSGRLGFVSV
jgi:hypothetical protein